MEWPSNCELNAQEVSVPDLDRVFLDTAADTGQVLSVGR